MPGHEPADAAIRALRMGAQEGERFIRHADAGGVSQESGLAEHGDLPCLHADPVVPDCPPGEFRAVRGWVSFYEGTDIGAELKRLNGVAFDQ